MTSVLYVYEARDTDVEKLISERFCSAVCASPSRPAIVAIRRAVAASGGTARYEEEKLEAVGRHIDEPRYPEKRLWVAAKNAATD